LDPVRVSPDSRADRPKPQSEVPPLAVMDATGLRTDSDEFSVVLGGPLYQMVRRAHLSGDALELMRRRILFFALVTWLPMLLLSVLGGRAWGDAVRVPLLFDIYVHGRFLLTLPLLIVAEMVVHQRMRPVVRQFLERDLIPPGSRARFDAAIAAALRLRNSVTAEVVLIIVVFGFGLFLWPRYVALDASTWYAVPGADHWLPPAGRRLSAAGRWFVYVANPLTQFILMRWYFRLFI